MSARKISYSAVCIALGVVFLAMASVLPKGRSVFYILSSLLIMMIVWIFDKKVGALCYVSTSLLSLLIVPNKIIMVLYILFFGIYPIVKALIERGLPLFYEIILKLLYYNFALIILYFVFKIILRSFPSFKYGLALTILSSEIIFLLYDYLLSMLLQRLKSLKILEGR